MSIPLTLTAKLTSQNLNIQLNIVFSIDGIPTKFGATAIYEYIRIGQDNLFIDNYLGEPWYIGGYKLIENQSDYISYSSGTTTRITQQLEPDKGLGTSASGLMISMIDKGDQLTEIISPGIGPLDEVLGKACTVQIGFTNNAYPEDYITIFKGIIETVDSNPGVVNFFLTSNEQKKRQTLLATESATNISGIPFLEIAPKGISSTLSGAVTFTGATSTVNFTAHGLANGDPVFFSSISVTKGVKANRYYYATDVTADTFQLSDTPNGSTILLTGDGSGTASAQTYLFVLQDHELSNDDPLIFTSVGSITGISASVTYYVIKINDHLFQIASSPGGGAVSFSGTSSVSTTNAISTLAISDATSFPVPVLGPDGNYDPSVEFFVRINDEFFKYTGKSGNTLTGISRQQSPFNSDIAPHEPGTDVNLVVRLTGSALDIARKLLVSGRNTFFESNLDITHFNYISPTEIVPNSIFFFGVDVAEDLGFVTGDYITTSGASNGANNVSAKQIIIIEKTNDGSYIVIDDVSFVNELNSSGTFSIRSQWDTLGFGCSMHPNDIDLVEFERINRLFLGGFSYDFRIQNQFIAREFIEQQVLRPTTAFSILRRGRTSIGFHSPPIPGAETLGLNQGNVENAARLKIKRSLSKNYYNTITYNFEQDDIDQNFKKIKVIKDDSSIEDFQVGQRSIVINGEGMRDSTGGSALATSGGGRFLNRYARAAEFIEGIEVRFGDIFSVDIGDNVVFDFSELKASDIKSGTRTGAARIFQVINKTMDLKSGKVSISVVDTNFTGAERYGLVSPSSLVNVGVSTTQFSIKGSFNSVYGTNEYLKWTRFGTPAVRIRSADGVTRIGVSRIQSISGNTVTLQTALSFVPKANDIMEFPPYNEQDTDESSVYVSMRNTGPFDDGKDLFSMI